MAETSDGVKVAGEAGNARADATDPARDNEEHELEAEEESAAAMDADVPHPPDDSQTRGGQPS